MASQIRETAAQLNLAASAFRLTEERGRKAA